jgi:hypothetical protein
VVPLAQKVMARPMKSSRSRPRAVAKNVTVDAAIAAAIVASPPPVAAKQYQVIKALVKKRMKENPGIFEALKFISVLKCLYCLKPLHQKKSNVDEHVSRQSHIDSVATMTVQGTGRHFFFMFSFHVYIFSLSLLCLPSLAKLMALHFMSIYRANAAHFFSDSNEENNNTFYHFFSMSLFSTLAYFVRFL